MPTFHGGHGVPAAVKADVAPLAKFLTLSRTTLIPRSSDAFSSSTRSRYEAPNSCLQMARIVLVLPVPGGP